jgi:hypothetical protein
MRAGHIIKIAVALIGFSTLASLALVVGWKLDLRSALTIVGAASCATLIIAAFIGWSAYFQSRGKAIVQNWAAKNGYLITQIESPFATGAFSFWTTSRGQVVYFVTIQTKEGQTRKAWVRCGTFTSGVLTDEIEVKWDDQLNNP